MLRWITPPFLCSPRVQRILYIELLPFEPPRLSSLSFQIRSLLRAPIVKSSSSFSISTFRSHTPIFLFFFLQIHSAHAASVCTAYESLVCLLWYPRLTAISSFHSPTLSFPGFVPILLWLRRFSGLLCLLSPSPKKKLFPISFSPTFPS